MRLFRDLAGGRNRREKTGSGRIDLAPARLRCPVSRSPYFADRNVSARLPAASIAFRK